MIVQSFILGNRVSLCMKIINSVVVVGLYYGFMTTFSIGPSYLFLLRARVVEEGEEGTEKKVSATTGFIAGQLMMFISIYYAPLHLALGRPHTITVLALPYLLFHFFWNNPKHFLDYGSTTRRNLSIQCVFLNNLIFQLFNHLILTSSMLARLVNIYMFRCNNKMLFVTSSFVGWLIGHILFMKWVGLVLVWIQQKNSSRSNVLIRFNKYLVSELINSMARIFSILLFITCIYYLGRIPSPIFTKKLKVKETSETEERDVEIETTFERSGTKQEQEVSAEEDPSPSLFSEEKEDTDKIEETEEIRVNGKEKKKTKHEFHFRFKETCDKNSPVYESSCSYLDGNQEKPKFEIFQLLKEKEDKFILWFEKPVVTLLFDYKRWARPVRYKKNNRFENAVQNEMSHYFFYTCQSDGKERISFTYPASLSTFLETIMKKIYFFTTEKLSSHEFYTHWNYTNEQKRKNLTRELRNRIEGSDKRSIILDILEKRTRLYNDKTQKKNLPKIYDPLLHGPYRVRLKKKISPVILNKTYIKNKIGMLWINKVHNIIIFNDYDNFDQTIDRVNRKSFSKEEVGSLFTEHERKQIDSEERIKILNFLFDAVITDPNDQKFRKKSIKEISKRVPRWSYKLIDNLDQELGEYDENLRGEHAFRSRKAKRLVVSVDHQTKEDVTLPHYLEQSDFRRYIIKGSMRAQRRKTVIWKPVQANVHSPLFLNRIDKPFNLSFDISELMKVIFRNWMWKKNDHKIYDYTNEKPRKLKKKKKKPKKERYTTQEKVRIKQAEGWDKRFLTRVLRSSMLVIQSILRKYIILPSLIIAKNLGRILLFQEPEWSEDFKDWRREIYVKCTYSGVNLSETEFPKNWLTEGIQIKILFPFRLKPWHRSKTKIQTSQKDAKGEEETDFCFLTALGLETEMPFGSPRKRRSFFEPIFKELKKKILKTKFFIVLRVFKEGKRKELSKRNLREIDELGETQKNSILSNQKIDESSIEIPSMDWPNFSRNEKKMKALTIRTSRIRNQIYKITKANKKGSLTQETNISSNKPTYSAKIVDASKKILKIFKKRNTRLTRKSYFFVKFFIEKLYRNFFLATLTIPRINAKAFRESTRKKIKIFEKNIHNNEENPEIIKKTNQNRIHFISTVKKSLLKISNKNSKISCNLSSFSQSQAYVFYKLLQAPTLNFFNLRPILQYHVTSLFLNNEIKYFFDKHGIFNYQLRHKPFWHFGRNLWKNCLSNHYQYDFSRIKWARLVPREWRNKAHQRCMAQNTDFTKRHSYEKNGLTHCEKQNFFEADSLHNKKSNFKKHYRYYYLLSYKSINYEDKKYSYIDRSLGQVDNKEEYYYNYNIKKGNLFAMLEGIPINNYLGEDDIIDMDKFLYRKYLDWSILNFYLRNKVNIEAWVDMDTGTNSKQNTKIGSDNSKKTDAINKRGPFYLTIHQDEEINPSNKKKTLFDWIGMNEEILSCPISNQEPWFFPELALLFNAYRTKPWIIPIKLLLFNFNGNGKKILTGKKEAYLFISSNQKEYLELSNKGQEEKELADQGNPESDAQNQVSLGSVLSNHEKGVEENSTRSDRKKRIKKKQYKRETDVQLDFFLKKYLCLQLRWRGTLSFREKILNDMKVYCHLVRLINPSDVTIASIQGGEICLAILITKKDFALTELTKGGMLIIEPRRLSVKNDGRFFIYQIVGISLVHKNKRKITKRYHEKGYVDKKKFNEFIAKHQKMTGNRKKNHYDLLTPENILFPKRRRELTTLICFNSKNQNGMERNPLFCTNVKSRGYFLDKNKDFSREKNQLIKLKFFIWTNSRLEDLICMNRYWFNTNNGSRFSMVRLHMYPRLKMR
uniref:Ycf1 n=1 Tax=Crowea saligna TaxID=1226069 RepID=UPI00286BC05F|nr:Ycf1 [Crowea saligna]WAJ49821.1 Ycf1 [Crowea saligna]